MSLSDKIEKYGRRKNFIWMAEVKQAIKDYLEFFKNREQHTKISYQELEDQAIEKFGKGLIK